MTGYLKRLLSSLGAYQVANILAKLIGVGMLPVYTGYIRTGAYGSIELLANGVILVSILTRFGMIESFLRFYYEDEDTARRNHLVRRSVIFMLVATTVVAGVVLVFAAPLSRVVLGDGQAAIFRIAVLGLWTFTNLELAYAVLRVDERLRAYATASVVNVLLTVAATFSLVVGARLGARGYLLGNYGASTVVLLGLWWTLRHRLRDPDRNAGHSWETLMRFGLPTVPAEASVYLLSVVDRAYLYHDQSRAAAGRYAFALKLAGAVSFIVTAFMYAWPPLAYSVRDEREAGRLYGLVTTYYLLVTGWVVAALALEGRFIVDLLAGRASYHGAFRALPWVALGWALYGLWVIFLTVAGRAKATTRNFPAAIVGLVVNVVALLALVPWLGIAGAGVALCVAYVAMLGVMHALTRHRFAVAFEWSRLARLTVVLGGIATAGDLLLPSTGIGGFALRLLAVLAVAPALLAVGFVHPAELRQARTLAARIRRGRALAARGET